MNAWGKSSQGRSEAHKGAGSGPGPLGLPAGPGDVPSWDLPLEGLEAWGVGRACSTHPLPVLCARAGAVPTFVASLTQIPVSVRSRAEERERQQREDRVPGAGRSWARPGLTGTGIGDGPGVPAVSLADSPVVLTEQ